MKAIFLYLSLIIYACASFAQNILPTPQHLKHLNSEFTFKKTVKLAYDKEWIKAFDNLTNNEFQLEKEKILKKSKFQLEKDLINKMYKLISGKEKSINFIIVNKEKQTIKTISGVVMMAMMAKNPKDSMLAYLKKNFKITIQ